MRNTIQAKLDEISNLEVGELVADGIIEVGTTYFGYSLQSDYVNSDFDKKKTIRFSFIGFLIRKNITTENTLQIIDIKSEEIADKLKDLNFKVSLKDVSQDNGIRKIQITGYAYGNEINEKLVI